MPRRIKTTSPIWTKTPRDASTRKEEQQFYSSARWQKLRLLFLAQYPLCEHCQAEGKMTWASHVHHRKERHDYPDLALDWDNLCSLCPSCHSKHHAKKAK